MAARAELVASAEAVLHTRASVKREHLAAFDEWQRTKHMPEIVMSPTCRAAGHFHAVVEGLPAAWQGTANVAANYHADDLAGLFALLQSRELAAAVEDGVRWFGRFNELDGSDYTGNIYTVVDRAGEDDGPPEAAFFMERFEVPPGLDTEFDDWCADHLAALAAADGVVAARSLRAVREGSPLPYYYSAGNRAVWVRIDEPAAVLGSGVLRALAGSRSQWDTRLAYVRREVYRRLFAVES
jgi:hypothetical protein